VKCSLSANNNEGDIMILAAELSNVEVDLVVGTPVDAIVAITGWPVRAHTAKKVCTIFCDGAPGTFRFFAITLFVLLTIRCGSMAIISPG
jgi:hypothetical protein